MIFNPFAILVFFFFFVGLIFLFALVQVGLITIAFEKIGLNSGQVFTFLFLSLLGSHVNIPIKQIRNQLSNIGSTVRYFGATYRLPKTPPAHTVVAVNFGGCLVPLALSVYLMLKWHLFMEPMAGIGIVALLTYWMARPVPGLGIAVPLFIPPLLAALTALILAPEGTQHAPVIAYIAGTMGTLIGADLMHLKDIGGLNAPVASIGGAGTFDGIFLTGVIAVLLA